MKNVKSKIKTIGVFTSGGDAPGMNAAIRSVVRSALFKKIKVLGFNQGYIGLVNNIYTEMNVSSVANIIQHGGTILKTGRLPSFKNISVRKKAKHNIEALGIDALIGIGGDGTYRGLYELNRDCNVPVLGIPGTIDNDINGSEQTIGFDSAVNTATEAIDKIRDTAASHDRLFIVEVMGRTSGFIAQQVGLACGAEEIFYPQSKTKLSEAIKHIKSGIKRGKKSSILITSENKRAGESYRLAQKIKKSAGFEAKICVLGHIQRGGPPSARDRVLASQMGNIAINNLIKLSQSSKKIACMVCVKNGQFLLSPLSVSFKSTKKHNLQIDRLIRTLSI